ncbi:MAG: hypothetical protein HQL50_13920 [Magnetococcales bacterium]|nr:hypothetical protein [Magnetococcales bacterium]
MARKFKLKVKGTVVHIKLKGEPGEDFTKEDLAKLLASESLVQELEETRKELEKRIEELKAKEERVDRLVEKLVAIRRERLESLLNQDEEPN